MFSERFTLPESMAGLFRNSDIEISKIIASVLSKSIQTGKPNVKRKKTDLSPILLSSIKDKISKIKPLLAQEIQQANSHLIWRQPGFGKIPNKIAKHMAVCEIIGPTGMINHNNVRAGLLFQENNITYPKHSHAAEEIYLLLSGPVDWQLDCETWDEYGSGDYIHHLPFQPHAIRTNEIPLFALWGWVGDISSNSYTI